MVDTRILKILVCPVTKASLQLSNDKTELICKTSRLAYPINDGIPVMLEQKARKISQEEYELLN